MELRHLRYFVAVAEELHFRRAAERLHMTQPPLSQQIRSLEQDVGVELLRRDRRGVTLTAPGRAFLVEARGVLAAADRAVATARRVELGELGELSVGFVGSTMYGRVPELLRVFREERREVRVHLRELPSSAQMEALQARQIDIGFLRPPIAADGIAVEMLFEEPMVAALPSDHPLASAGRVDLRSLRDEAIVTLSPVDAPGIAAATENLLAEAGVVPHVVQVVTEVPTAIGLVAAGFGVTFVPESVMALERTGVVYRTVAGKQQKVRFALAYRASDDAPVVQAFLELARGAGRRKAPESRPA
jgi:DNA-binding transcriptional LysR family regulator